MFSFMICLLVLIAGYFVYGKFVEKIFAPDNRPTPAVAMADGVDYVVLPNWKVFMIQFLNIAGTGPIFGAIMGAKFGPSCYLWIVFGCIFAGAVHDYLSGMLSIRHDGASLPTLVGKYLGEKARAFTLIFTVLLMIMVGTVFVYSPAEILKGIYGTTMFWVVVVFVYYIIATMLPIDKLIGKIYPLFAISLLFMAFALMIVLFVKMPHIPELWDGLDNRAYAADPSWTQDIFPCLFITVACGAISGFHATQSPIMARCVKSEMMGRKVFYGAMITEGIVALIWAAVSSYFFYGEPSPGYELLQADGFQTSAPRVVDIICQEWLGMVGGILALIGVVAAPITSGDTAFRSARLIISEALHVEQKSLHKRLLICGPLFASAIAMLVWQIDNPNGFNVIWQYFGWSNQTLSVITLWTLTVYMATKKKPYIITLVPALFMTMVCASFLLVSKQTIGLPPTLGYILGFSVTLTAAICFYIWLKKNRKEQVEQ